MPIPSHIRDRVREEIERELTDWIGRIVAEMQPRRVVVFGSAARGEAGEESDIDLAIIAETELSFFDRIGQALSLYSGRREVQALVYTPEEWRRMREEGRDFVRTIEEEGRVLYERADAGP